MISSENQSLIFFETEGDHWFVRNENTLKIAHEHDLVLSLIQLYNLKPTNVLEVGASNGWRLNAIKSLYNAHCVAVEPSEKAIDAGKVQYPDVRFVRALASQLPFDDSVKFDLVIINFVFCWIDRKDLLKSIAELDRVLSDNGILIIGDFLEDSNVKVRYHHIHNREVWTYKQDYARIFESSGIYSKIVSFTADHSTKELSTAVESDDRISVTLLKKDNKLYREIMLH